MDSYRKTFEVQSDEQILSPLALSDFEIQDGEAVTPLIAAIHQDRLALVAGMLAKGASPDQKTMFFSPLGAAIESPKANADKILELLLMHRPRLSQDDPFDFCPELNEPLLHAAVRRAKSAAVQLLLAHGADPRWKDTDCVSAATLAEQLKLDTISDLLARATVGEQDEMNSPENGGFQSSDVEAKVRREIEAFRKHFERPEA